MTSTLLDMQVPKGVPLSSEVTTVSDPVLPPQATTTLLSHFYDEIYDLRPESHLSRLLAVLLGDAGAGTLRKRLLYSHISSMVQTAHFYDIDRLFADVFGFGRFLSEGLGLDPTVQAGTMEEWEAVLAADTSYRNRVEQFAKGISWCPTPYGLQQVCSATIGYPVEIVESYLNVDLGARENPNVPASELTYGELEQFTYGDLEGRTFSEISLNGNPGAGGGSSPIEIGPGSTLVGSPLVFTGAALSTTLYTPPFGGFVADTLYYRTTPAADGALTIDTGLSTVTGPHSNWPLTLSMGIGIISGGTVLQTTTYSGREWMEVQVTSGTPLVFSVSIGGLWPTPIVMRALIQSADSTLDPWNPKSRPALKASRTSFIVRPMRPITQEERYHLIKVVDRLKPVGSRAVIDLNGVPAYTDCNVNGVYTPSSYWSIRGQVIPSTDLSSAYLRTGDPGEAVEQPSPVFSEYQGEEWHYNGDVLSVISYAIDESGVFQSVNYERTVNQTTRQTTDYLPAMGLTTPHDVERGKAVRDGILVTSPLQRVNT